MPANDDLVGVVGVPFVANVIEPAEGRAIARHHPVAVGGSKQATEFSLPPQVLLDTLISDPLLHARTA